MRKNKTETLSALRIKIEALRADIKQLNAKLAMSSAAFLNIVGKSADGVLIVNQDNMVVYTNYAAIKLFDRNLADLLGEPLALNIDAMQFDNASETETTTELRIPNAAGGETVTEVFVLQTVWNNEPCFVVNLRDITARKKSEALLHHTATHDFLTDLPNRAHLEMKIGEAIDYANEHKQHMAVLYLDLDDFKAVNDTFGHAVGDTLLKEVSTLLLRHVRHGDTVARLGGDEFVIILNTLRKPDYAAVVARAILERLGRVFLIHEKEVCINASIGIAVYPVCGANVTELLKNADTAMYAAKGHGKNQYRFFTQELSQQSEQNLHITNGLRHAIRNQELRLQFQPIIELQQLTCCGIEALVRWQHPRLGLVYPDQFLPYAEEIGSMSAIGRWIFKQALNDYSRMDLKSPLFLSVNMSATEFTSDDIDQFILSSMQEHTLLTNKLVVELTETILMSYPEIAIKNIKRLTAHGVRVAIDDYGIGYSSLSLLKHLPISILKIDKLFITDIGINLNDAVIIKSTIQLAHNLGLKVVAEGVETQDQLMFLQEHGCDYAQGYYFSEPLFVDQLVEYVNALNG
ncbi:MAG: EAL domain-containing protein [Gammaproteobacteria bacterium]|nr:EAL domain-containing protein [Gammaproteobacteria bacterium]